MTDRSLQDRLKESKAELNDLRGFFDYESKQKRLQSIKKEFENPELWKNQEKANL